MRSLTPFGSARLHPAAGHNEVVIGNMVNATETHDFKAALLMIFVDIALAPGHCIFARNLLLRSGDVLSALPDEKMCGFQPRRK
jgi:hypothetical protein